MSPGRSVAGGIEEQSVQPDVGEGNDGHEKEGDSKSESELEELCKEEGEEGDGGLETEAAWER